MSQNITPYPCLYQLKQPTETDGLNQNLTQIETRKLENEEQLNNDQNTNETSCIFQIVYPQELNLIPVNGIKRGRPRKKTAYNPDNNNKEKTQNVQKIDTQDEGKLLKNAQRTRSGRLVRLPKHIETDFKKIDITTDELDIHVTDFKRYEEKENTKKLEFIELKQKKRNISSQYRCPKCFKAYLGKQRMIEHIKKYPDHASIIDNAQQQYNNSNNKEFNFDVWNHLYDVTQKCKTGQKGAKFCDELTNLLHNLQLLKGTLFKPVNNDGNIGNDKNNVNIDRVLGNAIGLSPGKYKFNENELYKDVTILRLINSDFFKPNNNNNHNKEESESCNKKFKHDTIDLTNDLTKKIDDNTNLLNDDLTILSNVDDNTTLVDNNSNDLGDIMNVDQFINERFKGIIEPDIESNHSNQSLNLDLPSLELFQFHAS